MLKIKAKLIDPNKHCKLVSLHPSPLSCQKGFYGCNHFKEANKYLLEKKIEPISWYIAILFTSYM